MIRTQKVTSLIILISILFSCKSCAQKYEKAKFIDNQGLEKFYELSDQLKPESNLLFILLLDSSKKEAIYKFDNDLEEEFHKYSKHLNLSKSTVGFVTQESNLKDVLVSEESQNRILNCVYNEQFAHSIKSVFNYPIYIYQNKAIIEINSSISTDIFWITYNEGVVQINWLSGTIE